MALEFTDMQGLLVRGYGNLERAQYLMLGFTRRQSAKAYLKDLLPLITRADQKPEDYAIQIAFTFPGLAFLDVPREGLNSFSREFKEGMTEAHRQFILGDVKDNAPENWYWGARDVQDIHLLLLVYAKDSHKLRVVLEQETERAHGQDIKILHSLPTGRLRNQKEHFGFRDDISQPIIEGLSKSSGKDSGSTFPAGEFILGYKNLYEEYSPSPTIPASADSRGELPADESNAALKDFGKNGTYLVFRQMSQDVFTFWNYQMANSKNKEEAIKLASKMVGRWPDGSPLTLFPDSPDKENSETGFSDLNDFAYWEEDRMGLKCPIGAHIRRTNPRDHLVTEKNKKDSSQMVQKHRMIRKGRPYGEPVSDNMEPLDIMDKPDDHKERGLHFICLVTDIRRQFEFIQNNWVTFHKFGGLENDSDPIIGNHYQTDVLTTNEFCIPAYPVKRKLSRLPNFTTIRGGSYFFLPGLKAINFLTGSYEK